MPGFDTGLQHRIQRLAQQTADQHRHLAVLRREIDVAFERGALHDAQSALKRFDLALAAHFELEQGIFFPALHGLAPARVKDLETLEREHTGLLATLRELTARVENVSARASQAALAKWLAGLREHEQREEQLVGEISERA
jgi:iron-sulfur cluster repair protein YtfE (RIC family)